MRLEEYHVPPVEGIIRMGSMNKLPGPDSYVLLLLTARLRPTPSGDGNTVAAARVISVPQR